jgi:hypothetical protein
MSRRFNLFYAGYSAYAPSFYYDQIVMFEQLKNSANKVLTDRIHEAEQTLEDKRLEGVEFIKTSLSIATELKVEVLTEVVSAENYVDWRQTYISIFEESFPITKIDHYYFLFGRRACEIICNSNLLTHYITLLKLDEKNAILIKKTDKLLKDIEFVLFKMMASAALLSSEIRHHYFSVFYKELSTNFKPFLNVSVGELKANDLNKLSTNIDEYHTMALNGYNKCFDLLKEIGV